MRRYISLAPYLCILLLAASVVGCRESGTPARAEASAAEATQAALERSPADVIAQLQNLHAQRSYARIAEHIVGDGRAASVELLAAIDGVLSANAALQAAAEEHYRSPLTETWTLAAMADNIGPFSSRVRIIGQQFKGDRATVTLQAGENIPLIHAAFERVDGQWLYRPEPSPMRLAAELRELKRVLGDVEAAVRSGAPFESYLDAFYYRVLPQMVKVVTAKDGGAVEGRLAER